MLQFIENNGILLVYKDCAWREEYRPRKGSKEPVFVAYILFFVPFFREIMYIDIDYVQYNILIAEGRETSLLKAGMNCRISGHSGLRQNIKCAADV